MHNFHALRPWLAGTGQVAVVTLLVIGPYLDWDPLTFILLPIWIATVVLIAMAPAERAGFFVRYGAFFWIAIAAAAVPLGFLIDSYFPDEEDPGKTVDDYKMWMEVLNFIIYMLVAHLVLLSAIHTARFHAPRIRHEGKERVLEIRPRPTTGLGLRVAGMICIAFAVVDVLLWPIAVIPDRSATDYVLSFWIGGAFALVGMALLYASRFVGGVGRKLRVEVQRQ